MKNQAERYVRIVRVKIYRLHKWFKKFTGIVESNGLHANSMLGREMHDAGLSAEEAARKYINENLK